MDAAKRKYLAATAGAVAIWSSPAVAQETPADPSTEPSQRSATYADVTAGLGYSTNPRLQFGDSQGAAFGRASLRAVHSRVSERTRGSVSGFVEASGYLQDYGIESIFAIDGDIQHEASERVTLFGSAGVSGDIAGQLSNRFLYVPPLPEIPEPNVPPPVTVEDPDLFGFAGRQYRAYGQAGASFRTSERGSVTVSGGAQRVFYSEDLLNDYTSLFGNLSYNHALSERTSVGASLGVNRTDFDDSANSSTVINPAVYVRTRLSEYWDAHASIGVSIAEIDRDGTSETSTNLSAEGSLCRTSESERLCARVNRYSQASGREALVTTTSAEVDWYKKLDADQTVQLSAGVLRYAVDDALLDSASSHHYRIAASYNRRLNDRMSAGVDLSARSLRLDGPDPDPDLTGSVFVRYRLGDLG